MEIKKLYYKGYKKAFNVNYDDGVVQDIRFVKILNKYGIVGTFNLNSKLTMEELIWEHASGIKISRLTKEQVIMLYKGHEIASHSLTHSHLPSKNKKTIMRELIEDKKNLEEWFQCEIKGFAYPYDLYNALTTQCVKEAGFVYALIGDETEDFTYSKSPLIWRSSFFHVSQGLEKFVKDFSESQEELALCQIAGRSYELDMYHKWESVENVLFFISKQEDVWFASTIDIVEYLEAMKMVKISEDRITNFSNRDLWFEIDGKVNIVKKSSEIVIKI